MKLFAQVMRGAIAGTALFAVNAWADTAAELKALAAVDQVWVKSFNAGDAETMTKLYDENAVLMPPNAPAAKGRAAIKEVFAKEAVGASKAGIVFSLGDKPDGGVSGNMGWQSGTYAVKDKSGKVLETGKYLSVSAKKGGKWLYVRDTWNADAAPAAATPAPAAAATSPAPAPAAAPPAKK